ncbi:MAG: beta-lactamase family protein [Proteobacteria bacterium]|nr:beta-lactamase family protein [Pseudomonadota bacterium]
MHPLLRLAVGGALSLLATRAPCGEAAVRLHADLEQGLRHGLPSLSAAIATRQGVIWSTAVGLADLTTGSRAHPAYLYGIGSITKTFVACVIEQLADEGRLDLDTPLVSVLGAATLEHIPNAPDATVRQLLDHTSGIPSWEFDPVWIRHGRGSELEPGRIWGKAETLDYLRQGRDLPSHAPGQGYTYSNSNYTLLGLVIEKVTGADAVAEIHRRILGPAMLADIRFEGFEPIDARRVPARYHFVSADFIRDAGLSPAFRRVTPRLADVSASNLSTEWTAGAVLATAHDLALFARDLRDGAIVSAAALTRMQAFRPTDDPEEDMGQGLALDRYGRERLIGYTGNVLGFGAAMGWVPDEDVVIVVMTNAGSMHSGQSAYWPERFLKDTAFIHDARALARELAPRAATSRP